MKHGIWLACYTFLAALTFHLRNLCLKSAGFNEEYLQTNWIAFVSDGASVLVGKISGVATRLCEQYPRIFTWHCQNHRLELAVADALEDSTEMNHLKIYVTSLYSLFSQSAKNQRELCDLSSELGYQLLKIGRILDIRWVSSSFRTVSAVWKSFKALSTYFEKCSDDPTRDAKQRQRFKGLSSRLSCPEFLCNLGLLYDVLQELTALSLSTIAKVLHDHSKCRKAH